MLDLRPIKGRLEMASHDKGRRVGYPPDADLQYHAHGDLTALVAEVERLREAIEKHQRTIAPGDDYCGADVILWSAIDA